MGLLRRVCHNILGPAKGCWVVGGMAATKSAAYGFLGCLVPDATLHKTLPLSPAFKAGCKPALATSLDAELDGTLTVGLCVCWLVCDAEYGVTPLLTS